MRRVTAVAFYVLRVNPIYIFKFSLILAPDIKECFNMKTLY